MPVDADFLALRPCLAEHPLESDFAADLLSEAADAVIAGNMPRAADLLVQANMPVLRHFSRRVMDKTDPAVQRFRPIEANLTPGKRAKERMPPKGETLGIFKRDGFRCRYCCCRVVLPGARKTLRNIVPDALPVDDKNYHAAFLALNATLDHVVPHIRGGDNSPENIVTTCWPCNFGKEAYSLEELGLYQLPRFRTDAPNRAFRLR